MKLTVLGYQSPYPGLHQATPGYLLEDKRGTRVLLDCGSGIASTLPEFAETTALDAIVLSHYHHDHVADVGIFQYAYLMDMVEGKRKDPLPIYGPHLPSDKAEMRTYQNVTKGIDITSNQQVHIIGSLSFTFFLTDHEGPCYGMSITDGSHTIVYGADSGPLTDWSQVQHEPDLIILESTFLEENKKNEIKHLSAKEAALIANQLGAKRLLLTHLYPKLSPEEYNREARMYREGEIIMPRKGLQIILD